MTHAMIEVMLMSAMLMMAMNMTMLSVLSMLAALNMLMAMTGVDGNGDEDIDDVAISQQDKKPP